MDYGQVRHAETKLRCVRAHGEMRLVKQCSAVTTGPNNDDMKESDDAICLAASAICCTAKDRECLAQQLPTASLLRHGAD
jgi:hypothetical protein